MSIVSFCSDCSLPAHVDFRCYYHWFLLSANEKCPVCERIPKGRTSVSGCCKKPFCFDCMNAWKSTKYKCASCGEILTSLN